MQQACTELESTRARVCSLEQKLMRIEAHMTKQHDSFAEQVETLMTSVTASTAQIATACNLRVDDLSTQLNERLVDTMRTMAASC